MTEPAGRGEARGSVRSLQDAIRRMRVVATDRADGLADLAAAERARLELLAEELADIFRAVPPEADFFAFSVAPGEPPRLWIDMTSHVAMARDRRTYRFLKDTRLGRTVIRETAVLDEMADCVTDYVAARLIEREQALEAERLLRPQPLPAAPADAAAASRPARLGRYADLVAAFLVGALVGAAGLVLYAWLTQAA